MSSFRKSNKTQSDSRIIQTMKDNSHSKITFNYPRLSPSNKIPISSRNAYTRMNNQSPNIETIIIYDNNLRKSSNLNYNIISEEKKLRNSNTNNHFYVSKKIDLKNDKNPNQKTNYIHNAFEKKNNEKNENNNNYRKSSNDIVDKNRNNMYYINNKRNVNDYKSKTINNDNDNIYKKRNNNLIKNKKDNKEDNKFKPNIDTRQLNLNSSYDQIQKLKYIPKQNNTNSKNQFPALNNNSSLYTNKAIKTEKNIPYNNKIKIQNNTKDYKANNSRNQSEHTIHINKNYSFSSGLDFIKKIQPKNDQHSNSIHVKPDNSNNLYDLTQIKKETKNNNNNNSLNSYSSKGRKNSSKIKININLNTDNISNKPEETGKEKNKYAIKTTITNNRNILNKKIPENKTNNKNNNNIIKNDNNKKYSSYTYIPRSKNKEKMEEKEIISDKNKNLIIIPRKEEKIYITKRPQLSNNLPNEKEINNIAISYINSSKKNVNSIKNVLKKNKNEENNFSNFYSNNNSITYINTSSNKKKEQNKRKIQDTSNQKINKFDSTNNPNILNKKNETINTEENLEVNKDDKKQEIKNVIIDNNKEDLEDKNKNLLQKLEKKFDNINDEMNNIPSNDINNIEKKINKNELNINNEDNFNKLIGNIETNKNLNSTQKLEQKIKDLESKLDDLNNKPTSMFNLTEPEENYNNKYSILDKPGLSDITKEYLSSNLDYLAPNTELSEFSRAYMIGLDVYSNIINDRPSLSGLTKEFLEENGEEPKSNNIEIKEEKEENIEIY